VDGAFLVADGVILFQSLYIDPGFYFGELHKTILSGRLPVSVL
jgi:hypothetical protein